MGTGASVFLLITFLASMQDGLGLPLVRPQEVEAADGVPTQRERTKRCACSSLLDSECHYFCHLDIIWVNTPSKTTVYGVGSAPSRRRRSAGRCACARPDDQTCSNFCRRSPEITTPKQSLNRRRLNVLSTLRSLARYRRALDAADSDQAERKNAG